jgi:hypothetical protein
MKTCFSLSFLVSLIRILPGQTLENSSDFSTTYINLDGTIENSCHSAVGYLHSDDAIENSSHSTLGYVWKDGTVENSSCSTLGYASGIKQEWSAVCFFFFRF